MSDFTVEPHSDPAIDDILSDDSAPFRCEVCGTALTYGGRGRYPTRCSEHKKGSSNKSSGVGASPKGFAVLHEAVYNLYLTVGMGLTFIDPFDGMQVQQGAAKMADSWIELAKTDRKVEKFLRKLTTGSGWGAVIVAHAMVAIPIAQHHNVLPEKLLAARGSSNG